MQTMTRDLTINQALDLGCELFMAGNLDNAIGLFRGVLMHEPKNFEAIQRLGAALFQKGQYHEALYWFWRGIKLDRRSPMALTNYGLTISQLGHEDEGLIELEKAIYHAEKKKAPAEVMARVYNNLGNTLERLRRYPQALAALDKGIRYDGNDPFPRYNRGIVLLRLNRQQEAIESFDRAIATDPNDADAHYNRGMGRLLLGDLKGGLADYEWRLTTTENARPNLGLPPAKKWTGHQSLAGKTILLHCEQGLGDDIMMLRFVPLLADLKPSTIKAVTHSATRPFFEHHGIEVLTVGSDLGDYDHWVALMSLPLCFGVDDERKIPAPVAPKIDRARSSAFDNPKINQQNTDLRVGVCWAGNWRHKNDAHRSIPLSDFAALFAAPASFVSLQQLRLEDIPAFEALKARTPNLTAIQFQDLRDTAAAILNLDTVVTVDTAIAHLSASLGVPTHILVPAFGTDWRWQLGREDSPWYPAARLYRQPNVGDWGSVIERVKEEITRPTHTARQDEPRDGDIPRTAPSHSCSSSTGLGRPAEIRP